MSRWTGWSQDEAALHSGAAVKLQAGARLACRSAASQPAIAGRWGARDLPVVVARIPACRRGGRRCAATELPPEWLWQRGGTARVCDRARRRARAERKPCATLAPRLRPAASAARRLQRHRRVTPAARPTGAVRPGRRPWWDEGKNGAALDQAAQRRPGRSCMAGPLTGPHGQSVRDLHNVRRRAHCRTTGAGADAPGRDLCRAVALRTVRPAVLEAAAVRLRRWFSPTSRHSASCGTAPRCSCRRTTRGAGGGARCLTPTRRVWPRARPRSRRDRAADPHRSGMAVDAARYARLPSRAAQAVGGGLKMRSSSTPIRSSPTGTTATRISCAACCANWSAAAIDAGAGAAGRLEPRNLMADQGAGGRSTASPTLSRPARRDLRPTHSTTRRRWTAPTWSSCMNGPTRHWSRRSARCAATAGAFHPAVPRHASPRRFRRRGDRRASAADYDARAGVWRDAARRATSARAGAGRSSPGTRRRTRGVPSAAGAEAGRRSDLDRQLGRWRTRRRNLREFLIEPAARAGADAAACTASAIPPEALQRWANRRLALSPAGSPMPTCPQAFARHRMTVHVPRRPYVEALPGIPTIRVFEALACGIPLVCAPWHDDEGPVPSRRRIF